MPLHTTLSAHPSKAFTTVPAPSQRRESICISMRGDLWVEDDGTAAEGVSCSTGGAWASSRMAAHPSEVLLDHTWTLELIAFVAAFHKSKSTVAARVSWRVLWEPTSERTTGEGDHRRDGGRKQASEIKKNDEEKRFWYQ